MIVVALVLLAVWLIALTVAVWSLARVLAAEQLSVASGLGSRLRLDDDGPPIGEEIPPMLKHALADLGLNVKNETTRIMFLSSSCGVCYERLSELMNTRPDLTSAVFLLAGRADAQATKEFMQVLMDQSAHTVADPTARDLAAALSIHSTPFAVGVRGSHVVDKAYIRHGADFQTIGQLGTDLSAENQKRAQG